MTLTHRRLGRLFCCLLMLGSLALAADPNKTIVSDTIYRADGTPASGTLMISWPAFNTADGKPVGAGTKHVKIGADGAVNIELVPTAGATPAGTYYKVVLSLDDGTSSQEYWAVPTLSPTTIAAIRSSVVPATVAMQVVSREYVDGAIAETVRKAGDETIGGTKTFESSPLVPPPTAATAVANKDYVDAAVAAGGGNGHVLELDRGGTNQTLWTPARCVRVADDGSKLESAPADCGSGGGSGNATQIQGKDVDAPTTAGQQLTYNGAKFIAQAKEVIDIRDISGVDCTGNADSSAALNALLSTPDAITGKWLRTDGCASLMILTPLLVKGQTNFVIGNSAKFGTMVWGCGGTAGQGIITNQRSGHGTYRGLAIYPNGTGNGYCHGNSGAATIGILLDNNASLGGYNDTDITIEDSSFSAVSATGRDNWRGIATTAASNMEYLHIWRNTFDGHFAQGSRCIDIEGPQSQGDEIFENGVGNCQWGIFLVGPQAVVRNNVFGGTGNRNYFTSGASIGCAARSTTIAYNSANEGSGPFLTAVPNGCGSSVQSPTVFLHNGFGGTDSGAVTPGTYIVDVGSTGGIFVFKENWGSNPNGARPIIGTTTSPYDNVGGMQARVIDDGSNTWITNPYDPIPPQAGIESALLYVPGYATLLDKTLGSTVYPTAIRHSAGWTFRANYNKYVTTDDYTLRNLYGGFVIDHTSNLTGTHGFLLPMSFWGGLQTVAGPALGTMHADAMGGGSGSTWGYTVCGVTGGSNMKCASEVTVSSAATLNSSTYNRIRPPVAGTYSAYNVYRTTVPGGGSPATTGLIGTCSLTQLSYSPNYVIPGAGFGCSGGYDQYVYVYDQGAAGDSSSPPANTADGRIDSPVPPYVAGSPIAFANIAGTVGASQLPNPGASSKGGVQAKACTGTDKLSAIGTDGIPVCSADQTGGGGGSTPTGTGWVHVTSGVQDGAASTPTASDVGAVPTSRTVAGKALSSNITLASADLIDAASINAATLGTHSAGYFQTALGYTAAQAQSCANKVLAAVDAAATVGNCVTVGSSQVDTSIAKTGTDINTSNQVTATHLSAALPVNQGGTGTTSTLTGLVRGSASAMTAAELSGAVTTSGSNATTLATPYQTRTCEMHIWGSGTSQALQATDDEPASCRNKLGVSITITAIECWANAGTTTTVDVVTTGGSSILSSAVTCGNASFAAATLSGTPTLANNGTLDVNIGTADASTTSVRVVITYTVPVS